MRAVDALLTVTSQHHHSAFYYLLFQQQESPLVLPVLPKAYQLSTLLFKKKVFLFRFLFVDPSVHMFSLRSGAASRLARCTQRSARFGGAGRSSLPRTLRQSLHQSRPTMERGAILQTSLMLVDAVLRTRAGPESLEAIDEVDDDGT